VSAASGDQLQLFLADGAVTTQKITTVSTTETATTLGLARDPGVKYRSEASAVLLKRSQRTSIPVAVLLVLMTAGGLGLVHGLLITRLHLQPFVVTLCGLLIYRGVSRWLTSDNPAGFGELQQVLGPVASGRVGLAYRGEELVFGIPIPFFLLLLIAVLAAVFLNRTIWGRYLLALGRNEEAARFSGINTGRITVLAYVLCALLAAVGGMLFALEFSSISPSSFGNSFELYAIAAAVLGGCSLRGGEGSIAGVVIGTAVMQVLNNLIVLLKIPQSLEATIIGAVILVGVLGDELVRRAAARRRLKV
jgi:ribose transport system permease protein